MPRSPWTKPRPQLNKNDLLSDGFLAFLVNRFHRYRSPVDRNRLLSGINPDKRHNRMTVASAIVFICTLAAAKEWRSSYFRIAQYNRARQISKFINNPPAYLPTDVASTRKKNRVTEMNRIQALVSLAFARNSGYSTHSRSLWRCVEPAIGSEVLGHGDVDAFFAQIRLRLSHQYKKPGRSRRIVEQESDDIYAQLAATIRKASLEKTRPGDESLYTLLNARHRDT